MAEGLILACIEATVRMIYSGYSSPFTRVIPREQYWLERFSIFKENDFLRRWIILVLESSVGTSYGRFFFQTTDFSIRAFPERYEKRMVFEWRNDRKWVELTS